MTSEDLMKEHGLSYRRHTPLPLEIVDTTRADLTKWLGRWGMDRGAEIGTFDGEFAQMLLEGNPRLSLTCVDAWKVYDGYNDYRIQHTLDKAKERAYSVLDGRCTIVESMSVDAAARVPKESLDFVYIDGNHHLMHVLADIYSWEPKVRRGGIIAGHDYVLRFKWPNIQVVEAVHAYTEANRVRPWFVLGARDRGRSDVCRTWMWVKP